MDHLTTLPPLAEVSAEQDQPAPDRQIQGQPLRATWVQYTSADGRMVIGEWASEVGAWRVAYTEWESCEMLAGRVRLTGSTGLVQEYTIGDRFVIEPGFESVWEVLEPARKRFVVVTG